MIDRREPRHRGRTGLFIFVLIVVGLGAYRLFMPRPDARNGDPAGRCLLQARVYTDGEGSQNPRRILGVQNRGSRSWSDVQITIDGVGTSESNAGRPTGSYVLHLPLTDATVAPYRAREVTLDGFERAEGPRWVATTMRVTHAIVEAQVAGVSCHYEVDLAGLGSQRK